MGVKAGGGRRGDGHGLRINELSVFDVIVLQAPAHACVDVFREGAHLHTHEGGGR